ncbi:unnamed protein product [Dracunculus medinensis]|uniref:WS_DGAT_C domain-containing protein n=1 Tax=Dracunculus medinensis TaxID=318479 RepID=A0A0N4UMG9_DRAME|nr:unnamed protein product [Dracunculus medinensis]
MHPTCVFLNNQGTSEIGFVEGIVNTVGNFLLGSKFNIDRLEAFCEIKDALYKIDHPRGKTSQNRRSFDSGTISENDGDGKEYKGYSPSVGIPVYTKYRRNLYVINVRSLFSVFIVSVFEVRLGDILISDFIFILLSYLSY